MRIFITGATGFVGQALVRRLIGQGDNVSAWVRRPAEARAQLGPAVQLVDLGGGVPSLTAALENTEAIINLAGAPIAGGRWTRARRQEIQASRIGVTNDIVDALGAAPRRPAVLISASAVGYYGDRGEERLDEDSQPGTGFLAETCVAWEAAARRGESLGLRVLRPRFGAVLGPGGGFLGRLLPLVRGRIGTSLGNGRQFLPWIHIDDLLDFIIAALRDPRCAGAINLVAPQAVRMREMMEALARAAGRRLLPSVPAPLLRLALGQMAEVVLGSQRLEGERLRAWGYPPRFATLDSALANVVTAA
jgi:uncharacterized protein (TIGR01777 family)